MMNILDLFLHHGCAQDNHVWVAFVSARAVDISKMK
jgi:hypothetical protein